MPSMPNNALHRTLDSAGDGVRRAAVPSTSVRRIGLMRTILFLVAGLFLMASFLIVAKMFSEHFPSAPN